LFKSTVDKNRLNAVILHKSLSRAGSLLRFSTTSWQQKYFLTSTRLWLRNNLKLCPCVIPIRHSIKKLLDSILIKPKTILYVKSRSWCKRLTSKVSRQRVISRWLYDISFKKRNRYVKWRCTDLILLISLLKCGYKTQEPYSSRGRT